MKKMDNIDIPKIAKYMILKGINIPNGMDIPELEAELKRLKNIQPNAALDSNLTAVNNNFNDLLKDGLAALNNLDNENKQ